MEKKIEQVVRFNGKTFEQGDILKITIENEGTKNLYIGKFLYFKKSLRNIFSGKRRTKLVFMHHTLCAEGLFEIEDGEITDIKKLKT